MALMTPSVPPNIEELSFIASISGNLTYIALFSNFIPCGVHEGIHISRYFREDFEVQPETLHSDKHRVKLCPDYHASWVSGSYQGLEDESI